MRPLRQILTHQTRNWKLGPRLARNSWLALKGATPYASWTARGIAPQGILREIPIAAADARFAPRPPEFFEYIARCPAGPVSLYGIFDGAAQKGHFAICVLRGQARIAGVWLREPTQNAWAAAYFLAQRSARRLPGVNEIVGAGSEGVSGAGAAQAGFQVTLGPSVYLLDKKKNYPSVLNSNFRVRTMMRHSLILETRLIGREERSR